MKTNQTPQLEDEHPLDWAARIVSGRPILAGHLGVSVAAIGNWKLRGVPIEVCVKIERSTGGVVKRQLLRPCDWQDIWPELAPAHVSIAQAATETIATQGA